MKMIYKINFEAIGAGQPWDSLTPEQKKTYGKEKDSLPEYVVAENLNEAISKVAQQKLQFWVPYEFRLELSGNVL